MAKIFVISGPSGVGKGTIVKGILEHPELNLVWAKSYTTRAPRPSDQVEKHYFFVNVEEFKQLQSEGEILEAVYANGGWYGSSKKEIEQALAAGKNVVKEVEVNGGKNYRDLYPDAVLIFITAPLAQIEHQLVNRKQNTHHEVLERLATAKTELEAASWYDFVVQNEPAHPEKAINEVVTMIKQKAAH